MHSRSILSGLIRKSKTSSGRILVLTGARQTGKTTLVRLGFPEMKYIALDDPMMTVQYTSLTAGRLTCFLNRRKGMWRLRSNWQAGLRRPMPGILPVLNRFLPSIRRKEDLSRHSASSTLMNRELPYRLYLRFMAR